MKLIERRAEHFLTEWKSDRNRKPLILRGARQVGKTTLIQKFSESYKHSILLNLEKPRDINYFEVNDDVKSIVESLFIRFNIPSVDLRETLLFIDEIQESSKAISLLRFFYEEMPDLHVIAAGSLLEFAMRKIKGFPVGRVQYLYMHPLNFQEYLGATHQSSALDQLNHIPVQSVAHSLLIELFNRYTIIGGMPEAVKVYIERNNLADLPKIYESIWRTYHDDVQKYTTNETERKVIKHIINTAHLYLDQRIKFHNFGHSNYRSREVGEAFRNLDDAKVIQIIYPTTDMEVPVKPDLRKSPRLQFLDTGLVNHVLGIQAELVGMKDLGKAYKGAIIPHLITQELLSLNTMNYKKPNFWIRDKKQSSSEIDLVITYNNKVIPVEIKSGKTGTLRSLHQFIDRSNHPYAVRMYAGEFSIDKAITPNGSRYLLMNLPYYLGTKLRDYIEFFVQNY